jgi:hypothetical protein
MSNNIEWGHASYLPTPVDAETLTGSGDYEGVTEGEIGFWLGSDNAMILYGTPEQLLLAANAIIHGVVDQWEVPDDSAR